MINETSLDNLDQGIRGHIQLYPKLSVKAEQFESLFAGAIGSDGWIPYNHNPGSDMDTEHVGMMKPSLKSGILHNGFLTISSHRTTKYKTLEEKIIFLRSVDNDSYVCLARPKESLHNYKLIYFPKSVIDYTTLEWENIFNKKGEFSSWYGYNEDSTIKVKIVKSMSDQVWIDIHESLITILKEFNHENV
jgi:hypothetical protein